MNATLKVAMLGVALGIVIALWNFPTLARESRQTATSILPGVNMGCIFVAFAIAFGAVTMLVLGFGVDALMWLGVIQ